MTAEGKTNNIKAVVCCMCNLMIHIQGIARIIDLLLLTHMEEDTNTQDALSELDDSEQQDVTAEDGELNDLDFLIEEPEPATKEEKREYAARSQADHYATKLLNQEIEKDEIPDWIRGRAILRARDLREAAKVATEEIAEEDNEMEKLKMEVENIKKSTLKENQEKEKSLAKQLIKEFIETNNLNDSHFVKVYGESFKKDRDKYMAVNHMTLTEATNYALYKLSPRDNEEFDFSAPRSGKPASPSSTRELREINAALKSFGGWEISPEAYKKAKENGVI